MQLFEQDHPVVGMVHLAALPGTPRHTQSIAEITALATAEARQLVTAGVDALLIENMHDAPYMNRCVGPEIVATMAAVSRTIREQVDLPLGVQVLAGANRAALAVALASGAQFIRAEGFVFAHVADEGLMAEADAGGLLRYRRQIEADDVAIWCDIKKKHASHAITQDIDLAETARAAAFSGADAIIVTGVSTGAATAPDDVTEVHHATSLPVVVGSGCTPQQLPALWPGAHAFIVGSYFKQDGYWANALAPERIARFMDAVLELRRSRRAAGTGQEDRE